MVDNVVIMDLLFHNWRFWFRWRLIPSSFLHSGMRRLDSGKSSGHACPEPPGGGFRTIFMEKFRTKFVFLGTNFCCAGIFCRHFDSLSLYKYFGYQSCKKCSVNHIFHLQWQPYIVIVLVVRGLKQTSTLAKGRLYIRLGFDNNKSSDTGFAPIE